MPINVPILFVEGVFLSFCLALFKGKSKEIMKWLLLICAVASILRIDSFNAFSQCVGAPIQLLCFGTDKKEPSSH